MAVKRCAFVFAVFAISILLFGVAEDASAQEPDANQPAPSVKHPKFSSSIAKLVQAAESVPDILPLNDAAFYSAQPSMDAYLDSGILKIDDFGRLQVYIYAADGYERISADLISLGGSIEARNEAVGLMQARVPIRNLPLLAALDHVTAITPPDYGFVDIGSALTEGDALLDFDDLRSTLGVDGAGVTVGVISDGMFGADNAVANGDLPPITFNRNIGNKLVSTTGGVIASSFRADGDLEAGFSAGGKGAEGTAMLEIIHDIAPGAQLRFANFSTTLEFMAAVDFLSQNSDVVIDDISFFGGPYDQTSDVSLNTSDALNNPLNPIRAYYTSVGNSANKHYQETYLDSGVDGAGLLGFPGNVHQFSATGATTDCFSLGASTANMVVLSPGQTATVFLTWDEPFGGVISDYDLFAFESGTSILADSSISNNPSTGLPIELIVFANGSAGVKFYDIFIQNSENLSPPRTFDMFVLGSGVLNCGAGANTAFNYNTVGSSVPAQSDAGGGVISVGAINSFEPGADDIASYSSRGPANNGAMKPELVAIDGVSVTGSGGFSNPFFGTSAAAPHVAGLSALLLDLRPDLMNAEPGDDPGADRNTLRNAIAGTAVDLGTVGDDNVYGSGRVNGLAAGQLLEASAPVPEPIPSLSTWGIIALAAVFGLLVIRRVSRKSLVLNQSPSRR